MPQKVQYIDPPPVYSSPPVLIGLRSFDKGICDSTGLKNISIVQHRCQLTIFMALNQGALPKGQF